jgi:putative flippase GtrA
LKTEVLKFALVGVASTLVDLAVYTFAIFLFPGGHATAKGIGFLTGTATGFSLNRRWTFQDRDSRWKSGAKYFLLYAVTFALNIATNQFGLGLLGHDMGGVIGSFIFATAVSSVTNYLGLKLFVFRRTND